MSTRGTLLKDFFFYLFLKTTCYDKQFSSITYHIVATAAALHSLRIVEYFLRLIIKGNQNGILVCENYS